MADGMADGTEGVCLCVKAPLLSGWQVKQSGAIISVMVRRGEDKGHPEGVWGTHENEGGDRD